MSILSTAATPGLSIRLKEYKKQGDLVFLHCVKIEGFEQTHNKNDVCDAQSAKQKNLPEAHAGARSCPPTFTKRTEWNIYGMKKGCLLACVIKLRTQFRPPGLKKIS